MLSKLKLIGFAVAMLFPSIAWAQCSTANYYNSLFHPGCLSSVDLNNSWASPPVLGSARPNDVHANNLTVAGLFSLSNAIQVPASTAAGAGLIIPQGATPSAPPNGSVWTTSSGLFVQIGGGTIGPLGGGGGGGSNPPGGSTNSLQYNAGSGNFGGVALTTGQIPIGQASGAPVGAAISGDGTMTAAGVLTITKIGGVTLGALATLNTATVGTGGTGLTVGVAGGVPYYATTTTMASSAFLTNNALMLGGAASGPKTPVGLGTTAQVLHGNAAGAPTFSPVNAPTDIIGNFSIGNFNSGTGASSSTCWFGDATWKTCGSGGGSGAWTITDGTNTVTNVATLTLSGFLVGGSAGSATATPASVSRTSSANYTMAAIDMGNVRNMNGSSLTLTIPAISSTVFASSMQSIVCNFASTAVTISTTPTINGFPSSLPAVVNGIANCVGLSSNGTSLDATPFHTSAFLVQSNITGQAFTGGFIPTPFANTIASNAVAIDCANGPFQTLTNNNSAAVTVTMSANVGGCNLHVTNGATAGAFTFSGFSQGSNSGDTYATTNAAEFDIYFSKPGGAAAKKHYLISAYQ